MVVGKKNIKLRFLFSTYIILVGIVKYLVYKQLKTLISQRIFFAVAAACTNVCLFRDFKQTN